MKVTTAAAILSLTLVCVPAVYAGNFGSGANTFNIQFVTIGDAGNLPDVTGNPTPVGTVGIEFRIGKFEISEQMIDKANAEGGLGITKDIRSADKPATSISWNEAARFVNWLNTSTGNAPAYKFAVQPGEVGYNANANALTWAAIDGPAFNPANIYRNNAARFFLPSTNEWYKAAYFDPDVNSYYDYPTGSNTAPTSVNNGTAADTAVYNRPSGEGPADIMAAGGLSAYGTMGQGGNVFEWEESDFDLMNGPTGNSRSIRGGRWSSGSFDLRSLSRGASLPLNQQNFIGFRVASVIPEPNTLLLVAMAGLSLLQRRRARHR